MIKKFLEKKCTADEADKVIEWMHSKEFESGLLKQIENDLNQELTSRSRAGEDLKDILENIFLQDQIDQIEAGKTRYTIPAPSRKRDYFFLKIAASIALVFALAFYLSRYLGGEISKDSITAYQYIVKENSEGRRSTIFLPDGTVVNLNAASEIRYIDNFTDTSRVVYLSGEAFFQVAKDTARPFIVFTENISVTALGTSFNIHSYITEDKLSVSLASGKVVIKDQEKKVFLEPGQEVQYMKKEKQFTELRNFSPRLAYGWVDGIISFQSADLPQTLSKLERWFGVKFILQNDNPVPWSYTGEFNNQSLKSVLESLSFSQNFTYEIQDKKVLISFNRD